MVQAGLPDSVVEESRPGLELVVGTCACEYTPSSFGWAWDSRGLFPLLRHAHLPPHPLGILCTLYVSSVECYNIMRITGLAVWLDK